MKALIPLLAKLLQYFSTKVIAATGITFVTYKGYVVALDKFKSYVADAVNSMPADILNLLLMGGVGQGMGYLFGAFAFSLSMKAISNLTFVKSS